jgi:hypothetical protein
MSTENNDERTQAAGPADAGQQAGGSNNGSGSSRPSGRSGQRPEETGTIVVLLDPPSPHPGKRNSLVDARN